MDVSDEEKLHRTSAFVLDVSRALSLTATLLLNGEVHFYRDHSKFYVFFWLGLQRFLSCCATPSNICFSLALLNQSCLKCRWCHHKNTTLRTAVSCKNIRFYQLNQQPEWQSVDCLCSQRFATAKRVE